MGYEYMYSDSNRVYRYKNGNFYKVYDFNLQPGDSMKFYWDGNAFQCDTIGTLRVDSIGTTIINSDTLKFQKVSIFDDNFLTWQYDPYRIIERIGSLGFMFFYRHSCSFIVDADEYTPLRCYYDSTFGLYNNGVSASCNYIYNGINEVDFSSSISISPNPTTGIFTLSSSEKISRLVITDILGNVAHSSTHLLNNSTTIDLSGNPKGIYFVKVMDEKGNFGVKKIVLQ